MPLDALPVLSILDRITDADGDIVSLGSIEFYEAGTTTPREVFSDSGLSVSLGTIVYGDTGGYPVSTQGGSTKVSIYTGTGAYKVIVKDADGVALITRDNIPGALDTSNFAPESATPETPVVSKTAAYTIVAADKGKLFNCNCTGGSFVMTLPDVTVVGDNFRVGMRHDGTANTVTISSVLSQSIKQPGPATSHISLTGRGETFWLVSDGAGWTIESPFPHSRSNVAFFPVADRLTTAPTSPTAGARYIVNGTPTGTWSSYAEHDVLEADGNGGWIRLTPPTDCGWVAYVQDEDLLTQFRGSAWTDLSNITAPSSTTLKHALFLDQRADGTVGGTATTAAWTTATIQTEKTNTITGCSLSSNAITLPAGTYSVKAAKFMSAGNGQGIRLKLANGGSPIYYEGINNPLASAEKVTLHAFAAFTLASSDTLTLEYYAQSSSDTGDLGEALAISGNLETYASILIEEKTAQQGPQGIQGTQGSDGLDAAYPYQWSTSTSGDPGSGKIAGNNATIASITQLAVSETDSAGGSMAAVIATWDDSTSSVRAFVKISKEGATENFHAFQITGAGTDQGSYRTFPVTYVATSGTIANGTNCAVLVIEKGDKGDTGATGSAGVSPFDYTFSTTTTSGPSTGTIRANHATLSSATALYIHETDRLGVSQASAIAQWDDSTTTAVRGYITIVDLTTPANKVRFSITGANTDNGSDQTIVVTYVSGVTSLTAVNVAVLFERTGDKGADGAGSGDVAGPASSVANEIVLFDGTTGKLIKSATTTGMVKATSGVISAGVAGTDYVAPGGALGTPSSGTLTNCTGLPVAGITASTSTALGVGSIELGHATDTTLSRSSAGVLAVEGVTVPLNSTSSTHTASTIELGHASDTTLARVSAGVMSVEGETVHTNSIARTVSALGVELGHATDTTIARVSAGVISVEGETVHTNSIARTASVLGIEVGHATDSTLTRSSAGVLAVEGETIHTNSTSRTLTAGTIELGAAADTTISRTGAGAIAVEGVGVALNSTSLVHTASTIELGHASDTTLSRSSAGVLAVEGVTVSLNSTSATHTAGTIELGAATDTTVSRDSAGIIAVEGVPLYSQVPQNSQSAAYTAVLGDAQKHIFHPSSDNNARTFTIPANASVAYPIGTCLMFVNKINTVTIAITSDTLTLAGVGSTGSRTLAANGVATALKIASTEWIISGAGLT